MGLAPFSRFHDSDHRLFRFIPFSLKVHSGNPKNVGKIRVEEVAPVHRIGEKVDYIRAFIFGI